MKNNKLLLVAIREYIRTIRKPTFWLATIIFPVFMFGVTYISGYSAQYTEDKVKEEIQQVKRILIVNETGLINPNFIQAPYELINSIDEGVSEVKNNQAEVLFVYPNDIALSKSIQIFTQDEGIISYGKYTPVAQELLKQIILSEVNDPTKIALFNSPIQANTTYFKNGVENDVRLEKYIVPIVALILYFVMVFMGTNFLLMSVSEEKENRMMEIVLTTVTSKQLIWGKIVGLVGIVISQLIVLVTLGGIGLWFTLDRLPIQIDFSLIPISVLGIGLNLFYIFAGFLMIATAMVGVGAAMPTYRDAQQFSSFFIIAAIAPIYFVTIILADPNGLVARITSYFPLTSPLIFLGRNALGALPTWEALISIPLLIIYVAIGFWIAFKLFEFGSIEYKDKLSLKQLFNKR